VTALLEQAPVAAVAATPRRPNWLAALPWIVTAVVLVAVLRWTGTPAEDIAAYAGYWMFLIVPGTLVHRALRGSRGNLPEDFGYGAATGLVLELIAWAAAAAVGTQSLLRWWPVPVIALFLAVPRLRRHWRTRDPEPLPVTWSWLMAAVVLGLLGWAAYTFRELPLPPADTAYYQDLMYHLALVQELTRSMPFEVPQLAGDTLRYHYLSDAHMAAASMITGVSPATVLLRLWIVPVAATGALVVAGLAREITGRWWAGPLAAAVSVVGVPFTLGAPGVPIVGGTIMLLSPSQTYSFPLAVLLVAVVVDVLRGRRLGWTWVAVAVLALSCAGAKSSALPPLLAGVLLAGIVVWWRGTGVSVPAARRARAVPWPIAGLIASIGAAMAIGVKIFAGGGAGTLALHPLSALTWMEPYQRTLGHNDGVAPDGLFLPGVEHATAAARCFIAGLIVWWLLMQAPRLLGLILLLPRRAHPVRGAEGSARDLDPVAWLLGGATVAGLGATWAFWHPSSSQLYFFAGVVPLGSLLTVMLLTDLLPQGAPRRHRLVPLLGLVAGLLWAIVAPKSAAPTAMTLPGWTRALAEPVLRTAVVFIALLSAVAITGYVRRRTVPWRTVATIAVAAVLGCSIGTGADRSAEKLWDDARHPDTRGVTSRLITADEMRAALWLDRNAPNNDVVATNVHCQPVLTKPACDSRAFWVAGLGGHRTVVESWGYSDEAVQANGVGGRTYYYQPAPHPEAYALNEQAFTEPTRADLDQLRSQYGVRWLFADRRAGPVSDQLAVLTTVRFTSGPVTIYAL